MRNFIIQIDRSEHQKNNATNSRSTTTHTRPSTETALFKLSSYSQNDRHWQTCWYASGSTHQSTNLDLYSVNRVTPIETGVIPFWNWSESNVKQQHCKNHSSPYINSHMHIISSFMPCLFLVSLANYQAVHPASSSFIIVCIYSALDVFTRKRWEKPLWFVHPRAVVKRFHCQQHSMLNTTMMKD
jgi:hypothetical protein